jgi:hypothetical protein
MPAEQTYRERFMALHASLQNDLGMSPERAFGVARRQLGPDPDQPDLDPILRDAAASQAVKLGWRLLVLPKVGRYLGMIAAAGWGGAVVLKVAGAPEAAQWLESLLGHLGISPPVVDLLGAAIGGVAAGNVLARKGR